MRSTVPSSPVPVGSARQHPAAGAVQSQNHADAMGPVSIHLTQRLGVVIFAVGVLYLVLVAWGSSWWYVPALERLGPQAISEGTTFGGTAFFYNWAISGVLGAILVAFGAAVYAAAGRFRVVLFVACGLFLMVWLAFWSAPSHHPIVFGIGGGLILLCFLTSCLDWARMRSHLNDRRKTASDFRLAGHVCFFSAAWGLCGLLGAPTFAPRPELIGTNRPVAGASNLAVKVLVCLVLGWAFTALSERQERRGEEIAV